MAQFEVTATVKVSVIMMVKAADASEAEALFTDKLIMRADLIGLIDEVDGYEVVEDSITDTGIEAVEVITDE